MTYTPDTTGAAVRRTLLLCLHARKERVGFLVLGDSLCFLFGQPRLDGGAARGFHLARHVVLAPVLDNHETRHPVLLNGSRLQVPTFPLGDHDAETARRSVVVVRRSPRDLLDRLETDAVPRALSEVRLTRQFANAPHDRPQ